MDAWINVYAADGLFRASCVHYEDAAVLCSVLGDGAEARKGHAKKNMIWHEGHEEFSAGESYDRAAQIMADRMQQIG